MLSFGEDAASCAHRPTLPEPLFLSWAAAVSTQYVFTMHRLTKAYPPDKTVLTDITLAFLPGAKIGVLGLNGT